MRIDPRHLANLLSIARHGSFNRAAAACGISQPALSNSIRQLERKLGLRVLNRTAQGSALNEFGKLLVRNAEIIDSVLQHTAEEVQLQQLGVKGPLKIGVVPSLMIKFMPAVMATWLTHSPAVSITLIEGLDDHLLPSLLTGDLDLVLGPLTGVFPAQKGIVEESLFEDAFSIGVGPRHKLRARRTIALGELRDLPWVLPLPGNSYRRHIEALFMIEGVPWPSNCVFTSSLSLVEYMVAHTDRVTMITDLQSAMQNTWGIRSIPLKGGGKRSIGIKWRNDGELSPLAAAFVQSAREVAQSAPLQAKRTRRTTRL